jgi:hypothetical protein
MNAVAALLAASGGTFALRYASTRFFAARALEARLVDVLRHASLAIMASLVIASLPADHDFALANPAIAVGVAVGVLASRRVANVSLVLLLTVSGYAAVHALGA